VRVRDDLLDRGAWDGGATVGVAPPSRIRNRSSLMINVSKQLNFLFGHINASILKVEAGVVKGATCTYIRA
jgi:hypothetical protein